MKGDLLRKELALALRADPRQRFYLTNQDCEIILDIIIDHFKKAIKEGRGINLSGFGRLFMKRLGPRKLFNYKLRKAIDVPISFEPKLHLKPKFKYEVKKALLKIAEEEEKNNDDKA